MSKVKVGSAHKRFTIDIENESVDIKVLFDSPYGAVDLPQHNRKYDAREN